MVNQAIFRAVLTSALLGLLASCGTGDLAWYSDNTGAVSARVVFPAGAVLPEEDTSAPLALPDLSASVNTIRITAIPAAGSPVSADFPYAARTGALGGIPTGPNCRLVVEGIAGGAVRYRNAVAPILIEKGLTTDAGDVPMIRVKSGTCVFVDSGQALANTHTVAVAAADIDSNDSVDLLFVRVDQPNRIWLNGGTGGFSFTARQIGGSSLDAAIGDLDGSSGPDAVTAAFGPNLIWHNDGNGNFATTGPGLPGQDTLALALGDLDGDGDLDLAVGNYSADAVFFNDGTGVFTDSGQSLDENTTNALALGDIDGDGDLDLVAADTQRSEVWKNDGTGAFTRSGYLFPSFPHGSSDMAFGDVDGDGDLDLVLAMNGDEANRLFLNDGNGTFTDSGQDLGVAWTAAVALGDVDGDGDLDAVFGNETSSTRVFFNDGAGTFSDSGMALGDPDARTLDLVLADVDGDGDLDLIQANYNSSSRIFFNRTTDGPPTGKMYFVNGSQIWSWDGSAVEPVWDDSASGLLGTVNADTQLPLIPFGEDLVFRAWDVAATDYEPWIFRAATGEAEKIDLLAGGSSSPRDWAVYHDTLWISAYAGSGWGLFYYWNTSLAGGTFNSHQSWDSAQRVQDMFVFQDHLYFVVTDSGGDRDLWDHYEYSGGPAIWYIQKTGVSGSGINPMGPFNIESGNGTAVAWLGNRLFMSARTNFLEDDPEGSFNELWVSSNPGYYASLLRDVHPGGYPTELHPLSLAPFMDKLYFSANSAAYLATSDIGLWVYDGSSAPQEIALPAGFEVEGKLVPCGGKLFFAGLKKLPPSGMPPYDPYRLIWSYDGAGTFESIQVNPSADSYPRNLAAYGGRLMFVAYDGGETEPWEYDVAADSLRKVQVNPSGSSNPGPMTPWIRLIAD